MFTCLKMFKSLENLERPLLGPNIWSIEKLGLFFPKNLFGTFAYMMLHAAVTLFVFTQYIELFFIGSDLDQILTNLKISMLSSIVVVKSITFIIWRSNWKELIDYVSSADKEERDDKDDIRATILDRYTRYCRRITYFFWVLVFSTFLTVVTTPLIIFLSSETYREELRQGFHQFPHIFSSWMPFDKYSFPGCWITVIWHTTVCGYGAASMASYDGTTLVIMVFFGGKLDLLRERCKALFRPCGEVNEKDVIRLFRRFHHTHSQLIKYSTLFNSLLSPVMFLYVVMCSLMLCASAFQLTSATSTGQKFLMAEYLLFGIAQLFMYCWHSNDVLLKSEKVCFGPYASNWCAADFSQKKNMLLLMGQMNRKIVFTAGPFADLTLSTFVTILRGAYSYYTLLRN